MAKRSVAKAIMMKQSSAYKHQQLKPPTIHAMQTLKGWPRSNRFVSDEQAEALYRQKLYGGYSKKKNPICSSCQTMKSISGACSCTE